MQVGHTVQGVPVFAVLQLMDDDVYPPIDIVDPRGKVPGRHWPLVVLGFDVRPGERLRVGDVAEMTDLQLFQQRLAAREA